MPSPRVFALVSLAALAGCDAGRVSQQPPNLADRAVPQAEVSSAQQPLGEVIDTFPNDQERMVLLLTNLARHAPLNECGDWTMEQAGNAPKPPLVYSRIGNQAARYTSKHMSDIGCFQHESCCVLGDVNGNIECTAPANCNNDQCGKQCTGGTGTGARYSLLGMNTWSGENIARGYGSATAVWCGWMNSTGHRQNIYSGHSELGVGLFSSPNSCGLYWTQAFGSGSVTIPRIPAASAVYAPPQPQTAQNVYFAANYYDVSGKPPKRSVVVVNGHCFDMNKAWGVDGNATYETRFTAPDDIPAGCHPYYFLFVDDNADRWTYPDNGSLFVALGNNASCPNPYDAGQLPADCETGVQNCTEGEVRSCYTGPSGTENVGMCKGGVQSCKNGFWSACSQQKLPQPEVCDGLDNNCDGATDEGNPGSGASCQVMGERGECQAGERQCIGGGLACVSTVSPAQEVCDGLDNDCDGTVDDGFPLLTCGQGECFRKVPSCFNGQTQTCTPGDADAELEDGRDNDCDGIVDNGIDCRQPLADGGYVFGQARTCYSFPITDPDGGVTPPQLPCQRGVQVCGADGGWSACAGEVGPQTEVCDGKDNDCDGTVDDNDELGWQRCGTGNCAAYVQVCRQGMPFSCTPKSAGPETCDGTDDDCDGDIDNGCACRDGISFTCYSGDPRSLDAGVCQKGVQSCSGGQWTGCEGEVVPSDELCNQQDDDCDGVVDDDCVTPTVDAGTDAGSHSGGTDAGITPADAGEGSGGGGGGGGCGCGATAGGGPLLWVMAAFAAAARRRRRP